MGLKKYFKRDHKDENHKTKSKCKIAAKGICFAMIISMGLSLVYAMAIQDVRDSQEDAIVSLKEQQFEYIYSYLIVLKDQSLSNVKSISSDIESDINNQMDLDQLKADMDNGCQNEQLNSILKENIDEKYLNGINNYRNGIIVANNTGIIEDYSYDRSKHDDRTWESEISTSYNQKLEEDAIGKLLNHHSDYLIAIERTPVEGYNENHMMIDEMSYDSLKKVFMEEGIEGLKLYQFLVPAYITENGDVFGQQDIVEGKRNDTHKIIVIQEFSLYDQINKKFPQIIDNDDIDTLEVKHSNTLNWLYSLGCLYVISIVIVLIYMTSIYNSFIEINGLMDDDS